MSKNLEQISLSKAFRLRIGDDGKLYGYISHSSGEFYIAPEILAVLCQIAASKQKFEIKNIAKNLGQHYQSILKNLPDREECTVILNDLIAAGIVLRPQNHTSRSLLQDGFGDNWIQWAMLADHPRSQAYEQAIQKHIDKNSVVLDVGAGSGLLSAVCLKAGAKKVIAIEETQIAQKIIPLLNQLKLPTQKEKITVLNTNSMDAQLPQAVTHIVSELFGNDPFQEGVIPTLRNIGEKFNHQPFYIPQKISIYFELIDLLEHPTRHRIIAVQKEKNIHFKDDFLSAAKKIFCFNDISFPMALNKNNFIRVIKPVELGQLPLSPPLVYPQQKNHPLFGQQKIKIKEKAECLAGLLWFRVHLTESITISSHPQEKDAAEHWSPIFVLLNKSVSKNEELTISYGLNEQETLLQCGIYSGKLKMGGRG